MFSPAPSGTKDKEGRFLFVVTVGFGEKLSTPVSFVILAISFSELTVPFTFRQGCGGRGWGVGVGASLVLVIPGRASEGQLWAAIRKVLGERSLVASEFLKLLFFLLMFMLQNFTLWSNNTRCNLACPL